MSSDLREGAVGTRPTPSRFRRDGRWRIAGVLGSTAETGTGPFELVVADGHVERLVTESEGGAGDGAALVLAPLLVNAHDHGRGRGNVLAGIADAPLEPWIESLASARRTSQAELVGDGCKAMLASGVGASVLCVNPQGADTLEEVGAAIEAVLDLGVRAAVVYPFADTMRPLTGRGRDAVGMGEAALVARLEEFEDLSSTISDDRVELQLGPVAPQWVGEQTLAMLAEYARAESRRVHMHLLESRAQRAWADRTYPEGIVTFLERIGLLGPHLCVAHGTHLRTEELARLASSGTVLALNVSSNLRLASGVPPVALVEESTVTFGAGLDGLALGDDADYWNELRLLRGLAQAQSGRTLPAGPLLDRIGRGGAAALGRCAPDAVRVGALADFVLLDLADHEHLRTDHSWPLAEVLLSAARPNRVREVWVSGNGVYEAAAC